MERSEPPLVVIVGPTASGKTALAIRLARQHNGEIICADSRTVYKGMDIGTAKPSLEEQAGVTHWGLDLVVPGQRFTAADFKTYAYKKIAEIRARGHVPILVGGTGLYVDAVLFDYQFGADADPARRQQLAILTVDELRDYCTKNNIPLPENAHNKRYLIRAIEQQGVNTQRRQTPISESIIVGIATYKEVLRAKIALRIEHMLTNGVVEEATILAKKYGWNSEAMTGNIYPLVRQLLSGEMSRQEFVEKATTADWRLAKRQLTWLRRNPYIHWGQADELYQFVSARLPLCDKK